MTNAAFAAAARTADTGTVIDLTGDLDRSAQERLDVVLAEVLEQPGSVILNFTDVGYINSTGIALIVGLLARARAAGRTIQAFGLSDHYREIFQITRLSDFMSIHTDEAAAMAAR